MVFPAAFFAELCFNRNMLRLYVESLRVPYERGTHIIRVESLRVPNEHGTHIIHFPYNRGLLSTSKGSHWHTDTRTELRSRVHSRCQASKTLLLSVQVRAELVRPRLP
jgi:hypothetical protein